jgi:hypothetical protein
MSNYQKKIQALINEGKITTDLVATVLHDSWCNQIKPASSNDAGECNCDPEIRLNEVALIPNAEWRDEVYPLPNTGDE